MGTLRGRSGESGGDERAEGVWTFVAYRRQGGMEAGFHR